MNRAQRTDGTPVTHVTIPGIKEQLGNGNGRSAGVLHPAWATFVRYCQELQHGEIDCLKIQDGLPVLAEVSTRKIKFT